MFLLQVRCNRCRCHLLVFQQGCRLHQGIARSDLLQDMHHYAEALQPSGQLFMSGFYVGDLPIIEEECQRNGLRVEGYKERHNWVAVKVVKA